MLRLAKIKSLRKSRSKIQTQINQGYQHYFFFFFFQISVFFLSLIAPKFFLLLDANLQHLMLQKFWSELEGSILLSLPCTTGPRWCVWGPSGLSWRVAASSPVPAPDPGRARWCPHPLTLQWTRWEAGRYLAWAATGQVCSTWKDLEDSAAAKLLKRHTFTSYSIVWIEKI